MDRKINEFEIKMHWSCKCLTGHVKLGVSFRYHCFVLLIKRFRLFPLIFRTHGIRWWAQWKRKGNKSKKKKHSIFEIIPNTRVWALKFYSKPFLAATKTTNDPPLLLNRMMRLTQHIRLIESMALFVYRCFITFRRSFIFCYQTKCALSITYTNWILPNT